METVHSLRISPTLGVLRKELGKMNKIAKHPIHPFIIALLCSCSESAADDPSSGGPDLGVNAAPSDSATGTGGTATNAGPSDTAAGTGGTATNTGSSDGTTDLGSGGSGAGAGSDDNSADLGAGGGSSDVGSGGSGSDLGAGGGSSDLGAGGSSTDVGSGGSGTDLGSGGSGGSGTDLGSGGSESDMAPDGDEGMDAGAEGNEMAPTTPEVSVFLAGDNVDTNGPLQTVVEDLNFSGGGHILVRPTDITSEPDTKHPVAIWGPGGGTPPRDYLQLLTRMASQGFVIVGIRESTGDAVLMSAAIDWLEEQDADPNSPMHERLILDRVGVFGHSMGGLSSEAAALADSRVSTALLDNSGSFSHDALVNVTIPVGIIYGETGQEAPNAEGDFANPGNQGPCWLSMMAGGGHGSGPWDGASANVAWMRWHLGGENFRKDDFIGEGGDYNNNGIWRTQFKNWDGWKNWNE